MKTIALVQLKGGTGKSTIATNLAVGLSKHGKTVLIDGDPPQYSSASWFAVRHQGAEDPEDLTCVMSDEPENGDGRNLLSQIAELKNQGVDFVVIDCAPRLAMTSRVALLTSDLALIPLGSSFTDVWATQDALPLIKEALADDVNPTLKIRAVWSRFKSGTKMASKMEQDLSSIFPFQVMQTKLNDRIAYAEAFGLGLTVSELSSASKSSKEEVHQLITEVIQTLKEEA